MKKKILTLVLCLCMVLSLVALAGCGGTSTDTNSPNSGGDAASPSTPSDDASPTVPVDDGEPQYGGTLKMAMVNTIANPGNTALNSTNGSLTYLHCAYEALATYDETGSLLPKLATDWTVDTEEPSITWTLREGVQFADGTPFNAEAVKRNIEEYQANSRSETAVIASCDILGDYSIKMNLSYWDSAALESIGINILYMSPEALKNPDDLASTTCGTGPFQLSEFTSGISAKYVKNENYWQEGKPYLDAVEIDIIGEATTMKSAFLAEEYDILFSMDNEMSNDLLTNYADKFESGEFVKEENVSGQGMVTTGLIPYSADPNSPWSDARVRRAMCYALDVDGLNAAFNYGLTVVTNQWAAPGSITYDETLVGCEYNPEKAKALLAEAGYPDGFDTKLSVSGNTVLYTAIADMLTQVGIRTELDIIDTATFYAYMAGEWDGLTVHAATISPDLGLYMNRHLGPNAAFYGKGLAATDEIMDLMTRIKSAKTEDEKVELEHQMQQLIYNGEDGEMIFGCVLYVSPPQVIKHNWLHGDNTGVYHCNTWTIADAYLTK